MWCSFVLWRKVKTPVQSILSWRTRVCTDSFRLALSGTALALASQAALGVRKSRAVWGQTSL